MQREFTIRVKWLAFPLHPDTPPEGRTLKELFAGRNIDIPQMVAHLKQVAQALELPFGDRLMTYNSRLAQELGKWAEEMGKGERFHDAVFRAYFADGQNIGDIEILVDIARSVGLKGAAARGVLKAGLFKQAVDADWSRAHASGISAVPTFWMGGQSLVGAQPFNAIAKFIRQHHVGQRLSGR